MEQTNRAAAKALQSIRFLNEMLPPEERLTNISVHGVDERTRERASSVATGPAAEQEAQAAATAEPLLTVASDQLPPVEPAPISADDLQIVVDEADPIEKSLPNDSRPASPTPDEEQTTAEAAGVQPDTTPAATVRESALQESPSNRAGKKKTKKKVVEIM